MIKFLNFIRLSVVAFVMAGCIPDQTTKELPELNRLGTLRGRHFERVITHFHTPYSFDACDGGHGRDASGKPLDRYLNDLKFAVCTNRIDSLYFTDHTNFMADQNFEDLLFTRDRSLQIMATSGMAKGSGVARKIICDNGHEAILIPGFEGRLLALGMTKHLGSIAENRDVYSDDTPRSVKLLREKSEAIVVIPHTESKSQELIDSLKPDAMEIYNFHANFDPHIRRTYLNEKPFVHLFSFVDYLLDSYHVMHPDFMFMEFMKFYPVYFERWNKTLSQGRHVTGLGGTDAHENVFAQTVTDGERLDSYRRMSRFMSHFVLVDSPKADPYENYLSTKAAVKSGRVYLVVEGLGTPVGLDFHAALPATGKDSNGTVEMGESVSEKQHPILSFHLPRVFDESPGIKKYGQPPLRSELIFVDSAGTESVVSKVESSKSEMLVYPNPKPGIYRIKVTVIPTHLKDVARKGDLNLREFIWILSNPVYITQ